MINVGDIITRGVTRWEVTDVRHGSLAVNWCSLPAANSHATMEFAGQSILINSRASKGIFNADDSEVTLQANDGSLIICALKENKG